jgi:hypothetical protein
LERRVRRNLASYLLPGFVKCKRGCYSSRGVPTSLEGVGNTFVQHGSPLAITMVWK